MYKECARLILYRNILKQSILSNFASIFQDFATQEYNPSDLISRIYAEIKALLDLSTQYGFQKNLWQNYLTFLLLSDENSFSLVSEKQPHVQGSVHHFLDNDMQVFCQLFSYDFHPIEQALGIDCFTIISNYTALEKKEQMYNKNVSTMVQKISADIVAANSTQEVAKIITNFYHQYGVGIFGLNKAFRIKSNANGIEFLPINNIDQVVLSDLIGYEYQKEQLINNTKAFIMGQPANNVLLYGDSGTGKSTSMKAIVNEFYDDGLRMIEIY